MIRLHTYKMNRIICSILIVVSLLTIGIFIYSFNNTYQFLFNKDIQDINQRIANEKIFTRILKIGIPYLDYFIEKDDKVSENFFSVLLNNIFEISINNFHTIINAQYPAFSLVDYDEKIAANNITEEENTIIEQENVQDKNESEKEIDTRKDIEFDFLADEYKEDPLILIYHSHSTEGFSPSIEAVYSEIDYPYHTENLKKSVVELGKIMKEHIEEKYDIKVIHDKTMHDIPSYMMSYSNSLKTLKANFEKYPSIKAAIDIHRDAPVVNRQRSREMTTFNYGDKELARVMLVVGTNRMFKHPNWRQNYKFALKLQERMNEYYPGMARNINLRDERFNQHLLNRTILVEIGSFANILDEAIDTIKYFSDIIVEVLAEDLS